MNATEERLRDALKTVGDTVGPADVPAPRFTTRRRRLPRPVLATAAVAATAAVVAGGAALGGAFSPDGRIAPLASPLAPSPSTAPSPSGSTGPKVAVFLCLKTSANPSCDRKDATDVQKRAIRTRLEELPQVRAVGFENTREARERFETRFKNSPEVSRMLKNGDIPDAFRVTLVPGGDTTAVAKEMLGRPGVDTVIVEGR
ncbi:permease-like cell division protein FtsX [Actinomadura chokoriensis]|uniref:permease-like cell division protein FtsX n=1 Tax=Actinomadura chokoriensis TaxID=454156 RepID=UPI0031F7B539